jgi:hypothetical protein
VERTARSVDTFSGGETGQPWTSFEIEATISAYFDMLRRERRGELYTKREVVRGLIAIMPARSAGAIEYKFGNISAVLQEDGQDWIDGYKPYPNYQADLRDAVLARLAQERGLREALEQYGTSALVAPQRRPLATADVEVQPPGPSRSSRNTSTVRLTGGTLSALRDFQTKQLGDAGEEWVLDLERRQLARIGRRDLADRVEWWARVVGDGAGYDVTSFFPDGRRRFIEVKTTNYGIRTPFYITRGEVAFSKANAELYSLYRVHGFARDPRLYVLEGNVEERASLEPSVFLGRPA